MHDTVDRQTTARTEAPGGDFSRREHAATLALGFIVFVLPGVAFAPFLMGGFIRGHRAVIVRVIEPARDLADEIDQSVARQSSAIRGYLLTGDDAFLAEYRQAHGEEVRADGARPSGLARVGEALQARIPKILADLTGRLRAEPRFPLAGGLREADLEDHHAALIVDLTQALVVLEKSEEVSERLLQDGSEIQRVISELHGRQRAPTRWLPTARRRR